VSDKQRVLFVCLGNACRSQMAEGFARVYGKDVMIAQSAGLAPMAALPLETQRSMAEKNIDVGNQFPKALRDLRSSFDLVVNMSGFDLPPMGSTPLRVWHVRDPIGKDEKTYREVRDHIESLVMQLILELRRKNKTVKKS
jgi:arsenate reductase